MILTSLPLRCVRNESLTNGIGDEALQVGLAAGVTRQPGLVGLRSANPTYLLTQLRAIADKFRRSKERIPAQLVIGSTEEKPASHDTVGAEEIEQVIVEGLAAMHHSGQIARDLIRRFQGRILAGDGE